MSLTHAQAELLAFITRFQEENFGVSPSFEEMKQALGLRSKSGVHRLIQALVERGRLARRENRARALEVLPDAPPPETLHRFSTLELVTELHRRADEARAGMAVAA